MALGALCPHHETRGTSRVSLFLLNPQGAGVYHAPKYESIFSIILWSPWMSVCRACFSNSPDITVRKTFCCFALRCLFFFFLRNPGKPQYNLILPCGVSTSVFMKHLLGADCTANAAVVHLSCAVMCALAL